MKILVVNAGSSSLKYQLFDMDTNEVLAKGLCERIGIDGIITHKRPGAENYKADVDFPNHKAAIECVLALLTDKDKGVIAIILDYIVNEAKNVGVVSIETNHSLENNYKILQTWKNFDDVKQHKRYRCFLKELAPKKSRKTTKKAE